MPNMRSKIKAHNSRTIKNSKKASTPKKSCNCRKKDECPLRGKCMIESVVYKATVHSKNDEKAMVDQTGGQFKTRFRNHKKSLNNQKYSNETELSKYIWELLKEKQSYQIRWEIIKESNTSARTPVLCNLCFDEKIELTNCKNSLNKKKWINLHLSERDNSSCRTLGWRSPHSKGVKPRTPTLPRTVCNISTLSLSLSLSPPLSLSLSR